MYIFPPSSGNGSEIYRLCRNNRLCFKICRSSYGHQQVLILSKSRKYLKIDNESRFGFILKYWKQNFSLLLKANLFFYNRYVFVVGLRWPSYKCEVPIIWHFFWIQKDQKTKAGTLHVFSLAHCQLLQFKKRDLCKDANGPWCLLPVSSLCTNPGRAQGNKFALE